MNPIYDFACDAHLLPPEKVREIAHSMGKEGSVEDKRLTGEARCWLLGRVIGAIGDGMGEWWKRAKDAAADKVKEVKDE